MPPAVTKKANVANEVMQQLHMFHNPFADTTSQPKIPDGKVNESLGFTTQSVTEVRNAQGITTLHMLLYPGMNGAVLIDNLELGSGLASLGSRTYYIPGFTGSSGANWSGATTTGTEFQVLGIDDYAQWRLVSCGLQLKLLNSQEEDDGWWEAIRLNVEHANGDYILTTTNNAASPATNGALAPVGLLQESQTKAGTLVNEQSYSTGLLRDLHRVQFELHGRKDYHDFISMRNQIRIPGGAQVNVDNSTNFEVEFQPAYDQPWDLANQFMDNSYDMLYIRLHCRDNNGTDSLGSRFHVNAISNQEIMFDKAERESRFHTKSHSIGGSIGSHNYARRGGQNAAKYAYG